MINLVLGVIATVIAVISLFLSYCSYQVANDSNKIAKEALNVSKQNFAIEKRPYLDLKPVKFKEEDKYILAKEIANGIELRVQFEMKNTGQLPAKDIRIPNKIMLEFKKNDSPNWEPPNVSIQLPTVTDLVAGESIHVVMKIGFEFLEKWAPRENLRRVENNELLLPLKMVVFYKSDLDPSLEYRTSAFVTFRTNEVILSDTEIK